MNPHKGLNVPSQCSVLLTNKKKDALRKSNHSGAEYLFHESEYSKYDIGDKTLSCGRRCDSFKLWLCLKRSGMKGLAERAEFALQKAQYITQEIKNRPEMFKMVNEPQGTNICFWYIPPAFRNGATYSDEHKAAVHKEIFDRMQRQGTMLIQHNPLAEFSLPNFFRLVLKGEKTRLEDMDYIISEIDRLGQDITPETLQ
jgi:glutamate/tyrosine decarboxylase-like PLP-dependent enzyme